MDKGEYKKENLHVFNDENGHQIAHGSFNKLCKELMHNFNKYSGIEFNTETGKYYLVNNKKKE